MHIERPIFAPQFRKTQVLCSLKLSSFFNNELLTYNRYKILARFDEGANEETILKEVQEIMQKQICLDVLYNDAFFLNNNFNDYS